MELRRSEDLTSLFTGLPGITASAVVSSGSAGGSGGGGAQLTQGVVKAWDQSTGANTITVGGQDYTDITPIIPESMVLSVGDTVQILTYGASWFLYGRIATPGASPSLGPSAPADGPSLYAPQSRATDMLYWGKPLGSMVSLGGGTVNLSDITDYAIGTECASVATPASGAPACGFGVFSGPTLPDMTGKEVILWIKNQGMANTIDFKFWIGESGLSNAYIWNLSEAGTEYPFMRDGEWTRITLPLGAATINGVAPNLAALNSWQLKTFDNGVSPITLKLGGIGYVQQQTMYPDGVVTIRFDDLLKSAYTLAAPYMARYGFRATSYVIAETLFNPGPQFINYASLEEAHLLEEIYGWEHAAHAYLAEVHNQTVNQGGTGAKGYTAYPEANQVADMKACRDWLRAQGFRAPDHFSWPQGAWDFTARRSSKKLFSSTMTLAHANNETLPPADPTRIRCYAPPNTVTGSQLTAEVDKAIAGKEWLTVLFHNIVPTVTQATDTSQAAFETFVDYLASTGTPVRLVSELLLPLT